jgi:putative protein kinase ArgK-like GTPase of G3E family
LLAALDWRGEVYEVSAATGSGTGTLAQAVMRELEQLREVGDEGVADSEVEER